MKQRIAIIGAGITGLSAAYYLSKNKRFHVHLFEKNKRPGGLLGILNINGVGLEGYYHHLALSDIDIFKLTQELGLQDKFLYLPSKVGIFYKNKIYPFSSPFDLLRFTPVSLVTRLRLGLAALYLQKFVTKKNWKRLRRVSAEKWLKKYIGRQGYRVVWKPLLEGKFGPYSSKISMAWLWHRIHWRANSRKKNGIQETLVYFDGGFKILVDKLVSEIKKNGGKIYSNTAVKKISPLKNTKLNLELNNNHMKSLTFYKIIVTVPNPIFVKITPDLSNNMKHRLMKVKYRGACVAVLQLKRQFMQNIYWLNINDPFVDLLAVVEHTNFVSSEKYGGKHLLYAGSYPAQDSPIMSMPEEKLVNSLTHELKLINNNFDKSWVEKYWIFRDKYAQPIVRTDYHEYIPPVNTGIPNLYLVNMAQVYPEDRGANQAVRDGRRIAKRIIESRKNAAA